MNSLLPMIAGLLAGFILLTWSADRFINASIAIAENFHVSPLMIGMVLVGFGTAFPELVVSALAAAKGNANLSIGNVVGSNIANIGLCLGVTAMIKAVTVHSRIIRRDYVILFFVTLVVGAFCWVGTLDRISGIVLVVLLVLYLYWMFKNDAKTKASDDALIGEIEKEVPIVKMRPWVAWGWWLFSLALIFVSSEILIRSAVALAQWFHVSDLLIGLTVVAIGTSLPELAATVIAARKGEDDIAVGNVIGSNIFNILGVLAMPALISPAVLSSDIIHRDYPIMLGFTIMLWLLMVLPPHKGRVSPLSGVICFSAYVAYMTYLVVSS